MREFVKSQEKKSVLQVKRDWDGVDTAAEKKDVKRSFTNEMMQFRQEWIDCKVAAVMKHACEVNRPNAYTQRTGSTLTPLITGKI